MFLLKYRAVNIIQTQRWLNKKTNSFATKQLFLLFKQKNCIITYLVLLWVECKTHLSKKLKAFENWQPNDLVLYNKKNKS